MNCKCCESPEGKTVYSWDSSIDVLCRDCASFLFRALTQIEEKLKKAYEASKPVSKSWWHGRRIFECSGTGQCICMGC